MHPEYEQYDRAYKEGHFAEQASALMIWNTKMYNGCPVEWVDGGYRALGIVHGSLVEAYQTIDAAPFIISQSINRK